MKTNDSRKPTRVPRCLMCGLLVATMTTASARPDPAPETTIQDPVLEFDFPGLEIGIAEYEHGPTGTTVFRFTEPVKAVVDARGGSPGSINAMGLAGLYDAAYTDAVAFSGGSAYGLAAATGVAHAVRDRSDSPGDWREIAFVPGAIIYDLGWRRLNAVTPDAALGRAAYEAAVPGRFPLGAQGAGRFAMQGWVFDDPQHSGQGGAVRELGDVRVAVFTVVNPIGTIVNRAGRIVRCGQPPGSDCPDIASALVDRLASLAPEAPEAPSPGQTVNTTLTLVVINVDLPIAELRRLAMQVHGSMARAIQPFATRNDGDTLIAVTTAELGETELSLANLGILVSETAWDAVLASVPTTPDRGPETPVQWSEARIASTLGRYAFSRTATIRIARDGDQLTAHVPEPHSLYFPQEGTVELIPVSDDEVIIDHGPRYRVRFERDAGRVVGLYLEPGRWQQYAERVGMEGE